MSREIKPLKVRVWQDIETIGLCHTTMDLTNKSDVIVYVNEMDSFLHIDRFTGLHDSAGNPIYEGDLLGQYGVGGNNLSVVEWNDGGFVFLYKTCQLTAHDVQARQLLVLGNIHETPELLEGEG